MKTSWAPGLVLIGLFASASVAACDGEDHVERSDADVDDDVRLERDTSDEPRPDPVCASESNISGGFVDFSRYDGEYDPEICQYISCDYESVSWNTHLWLGPDGVFHFAYRMSGYSSTSMDYRLFLSGRWRFTGCDTILLSDLYDYCDDCGCESTKTVGFGGENYYMVDEGYDELEAEVTVMPDGSLSLTLPWPIEMDETALAPDATIDERSVFDIVPGETVVPRDPALGRPCGFLTGYPTGPCHQDETGELMCWSGMYTETWCITWSDSDFNVCAPQCDRDGAVYDDDYCKQYFGPSACCGRTSDGLYVCFVPPVSCE